MKSHRLKGSLCDTVRACGWRDGRMGGLWVCEGVEGEKQADRSHHLQIYTTQTFLCLMIACFYEPSVQPEEPYFISLMFP